MSVPWWVRQYTHQIRFIEESFFFISLIIIVVVAAAATTDTDTCAAADQLFVFFRLFISRFVKKNGYQEK